MTRLHYDGANQLTKITLPPAVTGGTQQQLEFHYAATGDVDWIEDALDQRTNFGGFSNGNWTSRTDRLGNVTTRTYGAKNELKTETTTASDAASSAAAHTVRFVYDGENHLRYRISAEGLVTEYGYTAEGFLGQVTEYPEHSYDISLLGPTDVPTEAQVDSWRNGLADRSSAKNFYSYYDLRGNVRQTKAIGANSTGGPSSVDSGVNDTFFTYDQAGNLLRRFVQGQNTEAFIYDGLNRLTSSVDVNGGTTTFVFNDAATTTTVTFATGLRQISVYNKAGELLTFTEQAVTPTALGEATGTANSDAYDKDGRLRWRIDATGKKSYFLYDQVGRKVADISSMGDVVEYRYDANNRLIATLVHGARYSGSFTALDDANAVIDPASYMPATDTSDLWSWNVYDNEGRLVQSIDGLGFTTIHVYDGAGRLVQSTSYANNVPTATVQGFKTTPPTTISNPWPLDDVNNRVARNFYDKDGRLLGILDGEGYLTRFTFDKAGQKVSETRYTNTTSAALRATGTLNQLASSITLDAAKDRTINYSYDGRGKLRYVIDSLGYVTQNDFDGANQVTNVIQYGAALGATTDYTFDNVKALIASGNLAASAGTRQSWTIYDSAGRAAYAINAEGAVVKNGYNAAGQLIKATQFAVVRATSSLPSLSTMDSWATANASSSNDRVTRFYYDGVGVLRYSVDAESYVSRTDVDAEGRVTKIVALAQQDHCR